MANSRSVATVLNTIGDAVLILRKTRISSERKGKSCKHRVRGKKEEPRGKKRTRNRNQQRVQAREED